jgi:hypothetical protein
MVATVEYMKKTLIVYEESMRQTGRTTRIVENAKATSSIVVCHNLAFAYALKKEFGIEAISLDRYFSSEYLRGKKPAKHVFDHFAEFTLIMKRLNEVEKILSSEGKNIIPFLWL